MVTDDQPDPAVSSIAAVMMGCRYCPPGAGGTDGL
jgi:hypothetical protein